MRITCINKMSCLFGFAVLLLIIISGICGIEDSYAWPGDGANGWLVNPNTRDANGGEYAANNVHPGIYIQWNNRVWWNTGNPPWQPPYVKIQWKRGEDTNWNDVILFDNRTGNSNGQWFTVPNVYFTNWARSGGIWIKITGCSDCYGTQISGCVDQDYFFVDGKIPNAPSCTGVIALDFPGQPNVVWGQWNNYKGKIRVFRWGFRCFCGNSQIED